MELCGLPSLAKGGLSPDCREKGFPVPGDQIPSLHNLLLNPGVEIHEHLGAVSFPEFQNIAVTQNVSNFFMH